MSTVIDLRPIVTAQIQAERAGLGDNTRRAIIRAVLREQREGRSGNAVAGAIYEARRSGSDYTPPTAA